jgi:hypothetical protein
MYAIRQRRKVASEKDFLDAVEKVIRQGSKFSSSGVSIIFRWSFPIIAAVLTKVCYSYSSINNTIRRRRQFTIDMQVVGKWIAKQCYNVSYNVVLQIQGFKNDATSARYAFGLHLSLPSITFMTDSGEHWLASHELIRA